MTSRNKDIVLRGWYQELWDSWNTAVADDLLTDDYRLHAPGVPVPLDRETTKQVVAMYGTSFPDLKHTVDEMTLKGIPLPPGGRCMEHIEGRSKGFRHRASTSLCQAIPSIT